MVDLGSYIGTRIHRDGRIYHDKRGGSPFGAAIE
jgi:hypothetical protein